jgi:hypothetical protein
MRHSAKNKNKCILHLKLLKIQPTSKIWHKFIGMVTKSILRSPFKFFIQQLNCHLMWLIKSPAWCLAAIISVEKAECRSSLEFLLKFSITTVKEEHTPLDLCP